MNWVLERIVRSCAKYRSKHIFTRKGSDRKSVGEASDNVGFGVLLFTAEFQIEPIAPNAISYDTRPATCKTNY